MVCACLGMFAWGEEEGEEEEEKGEEEEKDGEEE